MTRDLRLLFLLSLMFASNAALAQTERPNIVVVLIDDMGLMDTSVPFLTDVYGVAERHPLNDFYRTPSMERLAKQGIRFSNFYSMSVCSPTRTSLMTGQTSARHHTTNWIDPNSNNRGEFGPRNCPAHRRHPSSFNRPDARFATQSAIVIHRQRTRRTHHAGRSGAQ